MQIPGPHPDLPNWNLWRREHFQLGTLSLVLLKLENRCSLPSASSRETEDSQGGSV